MQLSVELFSWSFFCKSLKKFLKSFLFFKRKYHEFFNLFLEIFLDFFSFVTILKQINFVLVAIDMTPEIIHFLMRWFSKPMLCNHCSYFGSYSRYFKRNYPRPESEKNIESTIELANIALNENNFQKKSSCMNPLLVQV